MIVRSGKWPLRTTWRWPASSVRCSMAVDPLGDFGFDGLGQQPLGSVAKNRRSARPVTLAAGKRNDRIVTLSHGGVLLGK